MAPKRRRDLPKLAASENHQAFGALFSGDLLLPLLNLLTERERVGARLWSRKARAAVDSQIKKLMLAPGKIDGRAVSLKETIKFATGALANGCRPTMLGLSYVEGSLDEQREAAQELLAFAAEQATGRGVGHCSSVQHLPTQTLLLGAHLLHPRLAPTLAAALPNLTTLVLEHARLLSGCVSPFLPSRLHIDLCDKRALLSSVDGLATLLGRGSGSETPLLPHLRQLRLTFGRELNSTVDLLPRVWSALHGCSQLRDLALQNFDDRQQLRGLASLTQLQALELRWLYALSDLAPLTGLTRLMLTAEKCAEPGHFASLRSLRHLALPHCTLSASGVEVLAQLTHLEVRRFSGQVPVIVPAHGFAVPRCRLPPQLVELVLNDPAPIAVETLAALQAPPSLTTVRLPPELYVSVLRPVPYTISQLPAQGEADLVSVLGLLAGRAVWQERQAQSHPGLTLRMGWANTQASAAHLQHGHTRWLAALGRLRLPHLRLVGLALTAEDVWALAAGCTDELQSLDVSLCELAPQARAELDALPDTVQVLRPTGGGGR